MQDRASRDEQYRALVEAHGPSIARTAAMYERNPGDRDDLLQDIWLAVWQALPGFRGESSERTFIFRIAHNRGVSHAARRRLPLADPADADAIVDRNADPAARFSQSEDVRRLFRALGRLTLLDRQLMMLGLEGLEHAEIADVLGLTTNNVAVRLSRARKRLREMMQEAP